MDWAYIGFGREQMGLEGIKWVWTGTNGCEGNKWVWRRTWKGPNGFWKGPNGFGREQMGLEWKNGFGRELRREQMGSKGNKRFGMEQMGLEGNLEGNKWVWKGTNGFGT